MLDLLPGRSLSTVLTRLLEQSPAETADVGPWPDSLDPERTWFTSPELLSLWGDEAWEGLDDAQRRRLSFAEAVNFFSLNVHGESGLIAGLRDRISAVPQDDSVLDSYLAVMAAEEEQHSEYFRRFCERYAGGVLPPRTIVLSEDPEPLADFLFFARVVLFEDVVDWFNAVIALDPRVHPLVRRIHAHHHREETRHLAFGRRMVRQLWTEGSARWSKEEVDQARAALTGFLDLTWQTLHNPVVYAQCGIAEPWAVAERSVRGGESLRRKESAARRCLAYLRRHGVLAVAS